MSRFITNLFLFLLSVLLVAFLFANRMPVTVSFDPLSLEDPAASVTAPLWMALSGTLFIGFILGAMGMWISMGKTRRKSRKQRRRIAELEREAKQAGDTPATGRRGTTLPALR
ncbi:LapA family protein [Parvularcula maris]|uniref:LapA family protein n=1 Tax=Parvularcula maris TaxID=2965077 RepID=A0A9X2L6D6_9PROT|nr:LapA family protein [Parvularcula maris]MCQ8183897.1 LapA family protein [Parvularcula maris]